MKEVFPPLWIMTSKQDLLGFEAEICCSGQALRNELNVSTIHFMQAYRPKGWKSPLFKSL